MSEGVEGNKKNGKGLEKGKAFEEGLDRSDISKFNVR
jgi:hypothetical protein